MHRLLPARLLLVFALLFSQLGGLTHGIEHALAGQTQNQSSPDQSYPGKSSRDQSLPQDKHCDLCASYAQLGAAFGSNAVQFVPIKQQAAFIFSARFNLFSPAFTAFAARAPPYSA